MIRSISYNGYSLTDNDIKISNIQTLEQRDRDFALEKFAVSDGGKIVADQFTPKQITLFGYIKKTSQALLDDAIDELKKELLGTQEQYLLFDYSSGSRQFKGSFKTVTYDRQPHTIDYIEFTALFTISNTPFSESTSSIEPSISDFNTTLATIEDTSDTNSVSFDGTVRPEALIRVFVTNPVSVSKIILSITNNDAVTTNTEIATTFLDGDVIEYNLKEGWVRLNGDPVNFNGGFPNLTLSGNTMTLTVTGRAFDISYLIRYTPLWL